MIKSYIMIDPTGRFYQNTEGSKYIYSSNINDHGVKPCLEQVGFDLNKFIKRGGLYELKKPKEAEQPAAALESATLATLKL
jgi:radical S-adenosyl methionine domain-containing protein 2